MVEKLARKYYRGEKKMLIKYVKGDLFAHLPGGSESLVLVPHVVNDKNVFGAGFAGAVKKHFPRVGKAYHDWWGDRVTPEEPYILCNEPARSGYTQFVGVEDRLQGVWFANMVAQRGLIGPDNLRPLNYRDLAMCMGEVLDFLREPTVKAPVIMCSKFGSALAGGDWGFIEKLIEDTWVREGIPVTVFEL